MYKDYSYRILSQEDQSIFKLPEIKEYLRISHDNDDQLLMDMLEAAIQIAENFTQISLINKVIEVKGSKSNDIKLPKLPFIRFVEVKGDDEDILEDLIEVVEDKLVIKNDTIYDQLKVVYLCGFGDPKLIPAPVKQGILLHLASMYDGRGVSATCPESTMTMYSPYRKREI